MDAIPCVANCGSSMGTTEVTELDSKPSIPLNNAVSFRQEMILSEIRMGGSGDGPPSVRLWAWFKMHFTCSSSYSRVKIYCYTGFSGYDVITYRVTSLCEIPSPVYG